MNKLAEIGAALIGGAFHHAEALHGGDLSAIVRIELSDGREVIVKNGPAPKTEAAMLRAIAASGAPAPAVLAVSDEALVIELLPTGGSLSRAWASLGLVLARLHATSGARYGWPTDYAFGPVAIANGWTEDWPYFWAERRGEMLYHCVNCPLGGRIGGQCSDCGMRHKRGDEYNAAAATQDRKQLLDKEEWRADIDREEMVEILDCRVLDRGRL